MRERQFVKLTEDMAAQFATGKHDDGSPRVPGWAKKPLLIRRISASEDGRTIYVKLGRWAWKRRDQEDERGQRQRYGVVTKVIVVRAEDVDLRTVQDDPPA